MITSPLLPKRKSLWLRAGSVSQKIQFLAITTLIFLLSDE